MNRIRSALAALAVVALSSCSTTRAPIHQASEPQAKIFVVSANPLATEAGMAVLRRGGSAVDAAAAVQAMLSLVEPQSSGMGGGAFMNYLDATTGKVTVYDGREVAPAGAMPDMFTDGAGQIYPAGVPKVKGWAYRGRPVYTFYQDREPGDIMGNMARWFGMASFSAMRVPGRGASN